MAILESFLRWTTRHLGRFTGLALALAVCGCAAHREADLELPTEVRTELPQTWREPAGDLPVSDALLDLIADERLAALIEEALANNPNLAATALRLEASGLLARVTRARHLPRVDAGFEATRDNRSLDPETGGTRTANSLRPALSFSWELDLWGRLADERRAADTGYQAQEADWLALRDALAARIIQAWVTVVAERRAVAVQERRLALLAEVEDMWRARYRNGLASYDELATAKTQTALAQSDRDAQQNAVRQSERRLEVLLGRVPRTEIPGATELPEIGATGLDVPATVLLHRPDIRAALARLASARATASAADKARYPQLRLSGQVFREAARLDGLGSAATGWNLLGSLFQPLFDGGALALNARAEANLADAALMDLYEHVLRALEEVENALDRERTLTAQIESLDTALGEAHRSSAFFEKRYREGLDSLQSLLIAREQEISVRLQWENLQATRLVNRIDLALAAGLGTETRPWVGVTP